MRIVIIGAGFTGVQLARLLINEKNNVALIDNDEEIVRHATDRLDCTIISADGNSLDTLEKAGIAKADVLVCLTTSDEVNMITCSLVDAIYPDILKIARVRNYAYYVNTAEARKTHANTFAGKHRPLYGIDYMIHPDVEAADAIVKAVESGAVSNVVTFGESQMQISRVRVMKGSPLAGRTLMDLRSLTDIHMLVSYVEIDGKPSLPTGSTEMSENCTIGVLSRKEDVPAILELCGSKQQELRKIVIVGAGRIGSLVAEKIIQPRRNSFLKWIGGNAHKNSQKVVIIDSDDQLTKSASERFPEAHICKGDAADELFLQEEGIPHFDLAICATHNHELNMVLAAYLESLGVRQSIALVNNSAFAAIAQKLGVDVTVALKDVVVDSIMSHMRGKSVKEIHTVTNGELEIIECELASASKVNGRKMKDVAQPGKFLVLLVRHAGKSDYEIVNGETVFATGDHLALIADSEHTLKVLEFFGSKNE